MNKYFADAGTTWSKILELYTYSLESKSTLLKKFSVFEVEKEFEYKGTLFRGKTFVIPSSKLSKLDLQFDAATGHMVKNYIKSDGVYQNEVISLAYGAKKVIGEFKNITIIDLGSRDIKWVRFKDGKYKDLDWNGACGSATGATVEMLCSFYNVNPSKIKIQEKKYPVTCGVFAMEKIMDDIANDMPAEYAISKYIHGIAYNAWTFAGKPDSLFLSGGFCHNKCFVESLSKYCKVEPLGRYVLLEGLL